MGATTTTAPAVEVHHEIPRCILRLRDRLDVAPPDEDVIPLYIEYEHECERYGIDAGVPRGQLAAFIEASTVIMPRPEHRALHESDFVRWGRRGGVVTLARYGRSWFALLALKRWGKVPAERLEAEISALRAAAGQGQAA